MTVWANGTTTMPTMSSPYGYSDDYDGFHGGADFKDFDYNCAHEPGRVIYSGWTDFGDRGGGIEVAIQHDGWISRILHNASVLVSVGETVSEGQQVGVQGGSGYGRQGYYGKHCHDEVRLRGRNGLTTDPVAFLSARVGSSTAGGGSRPLPTPILAPPMKGQPMTQVIYTNILTPLSEADEATLRSYIGGASLSLKPGGGIVALVGDCPGTPANVQLTQSDQRANGWAADHTGLYRDPTTNVLKLDQAGRPYENDEFMALLAAYAAPVAMHAAP